MINIEFGNDTVYEYKSFEEIFNLPNYEDITYLNCSKNNLTEIPNEISKFLNKYQIKYKKKQNPVSTPGGKHGHLYAHFLFS